MSRTGGRGSRMPLVVLEKTPNGEASLRAVDVRRGLFS